MENVFLNRKNFILVFFLVSFGALAESGTVWDLDNMQKQRVLYEAKAALNKAKAEAEIKDFGATSQANPSTVSGISGVSTSQADVLPQLVKISGKNAVLSMQDGNTTSVTAGQLLPGGRWQVLSIGLGGVKVKNISTQSIQVIN
ncbi:type IV pilus biogenesis protein PilP [Enterobacter soli]|nr:type IV pilus biogenesis protein PilP [Enterobacter roggenkampii]